MIRANLIYIPLISTRMPVCLLFVYHKKSTLLNQKCYRYFSLKTTISSQQIFQCLVRNKQFKFSRVFLIMADCKFYPAQLSLFWFQKRAKIWTAYFWPKIGISAERKWSFWDWNTCTVNSVENMSTVWKTPSNSVENVFHTVDSMENEFNSAFSSNCSTQKVLKIKKNYMLLQFFSMI